MEKIQDGWFKLRLRPAFLPFLQLPGRSRGKRLVLIDTYIQNDKETEIGAVNLKLSKLSLDSNAVLYDFDQHNPVRTIPSLIDSGT